MGEAATGRGVPSALLGYASWFLQAKLKSPL